MENKKVTTRRKTRKELEKKVDEIFKGLQEIRVLGANLEIKKRAIIEKRVDELEKNKVQLESHIKTLETNFASETERTNALVTTSNQLLSANNAAYIVINCFERWLDDNHPKWDDGYRKDAEKRSDLLKERAGIAAVVNERGETNPAILNQLAERLIIISKDVGTYADDIPMIMSIYMKSRNIERAEALLNDVRSSKMEISKQTDFLLTKLEDELKKRTLEPLKMPPPNERRIITR